MISAEVLDRLFEAPLDEFTTTRGALVAELKESGDAKGAAELKAIRKPTVGAWAVNQLARRHPSEVSRLFEIRDEIAASGDATVMRRGAEERKKLLVSLVAKAEAVLDEAGHSATTTATERIMQTLQAGDSDEDREAIEKGRLTKELSPSGFGGLSGFAPTGDLAGDDVEEEEEDASAEERRRANALEAEAAAAEGEREAAEEEVARLRQELTRAERSASAASKRATKAREKADKAKGGLD